MPKQKAMKRIFALLVLLCSGLLLHAQTTLMGRVTDENGNGLPYASVILYKNGIYKTGMETDSTGWYFFQNDPAQNRELDPGTYDVKTSYLGYGTRAVRGVKVYAQTANYQDFMLEDGSVNLETVVVSAQAHTGFGCIYICGSGTIEPESRTPEATASGRRPEDLSIFPTPASTHATVRIPAATQGLTLLNLSGQPLRSWAHLERGPLSFSVSQLPPGNYVVVAETLEGSRYGKLLVAR